MLLGSIILALVGLFALSTYPVHTAGSFGQLAFFSDSACTKSFDPSTIPGINKTFTAWPNLPASDVPSVVNTSDASFQPPCINNPLPAFPVVKSGLYSCWNTDVSNSNTRGFVTQEFVYSGCDTPTNTTLPFQWFLFEGPKASTCVHGTIWALIEDGLGNVINTTVNNATWATFTCSGAATSVSSSSSSSSAGSAVNTGGNTGGNGNSGSGSNGVGSVTVSMAALISLMSVMAALLREMAV